MSMEIIAYRNSDDIDVKFEDGSIARNKAMSSFNSGKIAPPNRLQIKYCNMHVLANNGLYMRVKEYRSQKDIDIEFEDNTVVRNKAVNDFLKGRIGHPAIPKQLSQRKGTTGKIGDFILLKVVNKSKSGVYYLCKCNKCAYEDIMTPQEMMSHKCC